MVTGGARTCLAGAITVGLAAWGLTGVTPAAAQAPAQQKELSEKSVQILMNYAWTILPAKFTAPNGKSIEVDKSKPDALVPVDTGRDVIKAAYLSAQAQLCDMWEDQVANYDALMARERAKGKWTDQQLLYITTLHRMTIHMAAGKLKVVEKGKDELQVTLEPIEPSKDTCTDAKRKQVKEAIAAYVSTAPKPPAAAAPVQTGATPPAQPVPAAAKDKKK
jgi:hypothetical protein